MKISQMEITDYSEAYELWTNTEGMGLRTLDDSEAGIGKFLKRNPTTNFICRINNELIGAILCGHDGRRAYIYHAVVHTDFRKKGIGKKLVDKVLQSLDREGIKKVALVVYGDNQVGNQFWKTLGFTLREDLNYRDKVIDILNI